MKRTARDVVFTSVAAHLNVRNVVESCAFFVDKLGFEVDFEYGEPPFYAQVSRDRALLALRFVHEAPVADAPRAREQLLSASITVASHSEIESLFAGYLAAGVPFVQKLRTEPWGATTFIVADPDGNLVLFAGPDE